MDESRTSQHCSDGNRLDTWHPTQRPWGIKTITDTDTFIQHWIHLYYRYLFCGRSEKEALEFLKSHGATHLMLTEEGVVRYAHINSSLGSRSEQEKPFEIIYLQEVIREQEHLVLVSERETPFFKNIQVDMHTETNRPFSAIVIRQNGTATNLPYVAYENKKRTAANDQNGSKTGGILLYFDEQQKFQKCYYVPPIAWDNFAIRLFLRGVSSDAFLPVYTNSKTGATTVKVWEIHYPPRHPTEPQIPQNRGS